MVRGTLVGEGDDDGGGGKGTWSYAAVRADMNEPRNAAIRRAIFGVLTLFGVINMIILLSMTLEQVDSASYAIPYNTVTGSVANDVKSEGLHAKPPYGQFILWPKTYATKGESVECNSLDGVRIRVDVSFQYLPRQKALYDLTKLYEKESNYEVVLAWHSRSAIRNGCAEFTTQEFQTQRSVVQGAMYDRLKDRLSAYMETDVVDVQLTNIARPAEYEVEVDAKEGARNDIDKAENERAQALTQANTVLLEAQINANKTLDTARTAAENALTVAQAEADVITGRYAALAETYLAVKDTHAMSTEALLTYIATRLHGDTRGATFGLDAPAQTSYVGDLSTT